MSARNSVQRRTLAAVVIAPIGFACTVGPIAIPIYLLFGGGRGRQS